MKRALVLGGIVFAGCLFAETAEEAYARLSSYRSLWETNTVAYYKTVRATKGPTLAAANGRWFLDFLAYPDVSETNRLIKVLDAKQKVIFDNADAYGIRDNTNCWYALADYIARLKDVSDPRWIDERYDFVTEVLDDGVTFGGNTNPLLNFATYKLEHYEEYRRQHTNLVTDTEVLNAFYAEWSDGVSERQTRERELAYLQKKAKQTMKERFWLFGTKGLSDSEKAVCRSNIVERAHLTPEEEHEMFEVIPHWFKGLGR